MQNFWFLLLCIFCDMIFVLPRPKSGHSYDNILRSDKGVCACDHFIFHGVYCNMLILRVLWPLKRGRVSPLLLFCFSVSITMEVSKLKEEEGSNYWCQFRTCELIIDKLPKLWSYKLIQFGFQQEHVNVVRNIGNKLTTLLQ